MNLNDLNSFSTLFTYFRGNELIIFAESLII